MRRQLADREQTEPRRCGSFIEGDYGGVITESWSRKEGEEREM